MKLKIMLIQYYFEVSDLKKIFKIYKFKIITQTVANNLSRLKLV